jgi:hypothetical protein
LKNVNAPPLMGLKRLHEMDAATDPNFNDVVNASPAKVDDPDAAEGPGLGEIEVNASPVRHRRRR